MDGPTLIVIRCRCNILQDYEGVCSEQQQWRGWRKGNKENEKMKKKEIKQKKNGKMKKGIWKGTGISNSAQSYQLREHPFLQRYEKN